MAARRPPAAPEVEPKAFQKAEEIDRAITKLERRIKEIAVIDFFAAERDHTGADGAATSNLRNTILEIYGPNSPEYREHQHIDFWAGPMFVDMHPGQILEGRENGRRQVIGIINGLIARLKEKREDLQGGEPPGPSSYFDNLNLHPRIADVSRDLFVNGYHFEAVFAGAKALVNYVKERSGRHDLDGAPLVRIQIAAKVLKIIATRRTQIDLFCKRRRLNFI
jgi:hypothetical protein